MYPCILVPVEDVKLLMSWSTKSESSQPAVVFLEYRRRRPRAPDRALPSTEFRSLSGHYLLWGGYRISRRWAGSYPSLGGPVQAGLAFTLPTQAL